MKRVGYVLAATLVVCAMAHGQQQREAKPKTEQEVWLSAKRKAELKGLLEMPVIVKTVPTGDGMREVTWSKGGNTWVSTQSVGRVASGVATNSFRAKLEAVRAEKQAILDDLETLSKQKTISKADVEAVIDNAAKKTATPKEEIIIGK